MIKIELVTTPGCDVCARIKKTLDELKHAYTFEVIEYTTSSKRGHHLIDKYDIRSSPGIVINDEYFTSGDTSKEDFIQRFEEIKNR